MSEPNPAHGQINDLFSKSHASNEKFDYFICGVAGALFAYIGQHFQPDKQPLFSCIAMFLALASLSITFFCGCRRVQLQTAVVRSNQHIISTEETIKKMNARIDEYTPHEQQGEKVTVFTDIKDESYTLDEFRQMRDKQYSELAIYRAEMESDKPIYARYGRVRDITLAIGFVLILVSKILQIYPHN